MEVIFEDNHLLVVNKPSGILTQPSGTDQESLEKLAKEWIKARYQKPGNVFLEAVHRLDKPASGVVVFARTSKALARLQESMRNKISTKLYWALIEGRLSETEGKLENYLVHDDFCARVVESSFPAAKSALLSYHLLKQKENLSLVEIILTTGRYHQIRVQFSHLGCPIVGDQKYGSRIPYRPGAIALHHHRIVIPHPITKVLLTWVAPIPSDFNHFLENT